MKQKKIKILSQYLNLEFCAIFFFVSFFDVLFFLFFCASFDAVNGK